MRAITATMSVTLDGVVIALPPERTPAAYSPTEAGAGHTTTRSLARDGQGMSKPSDMLFASGPGRTSSARGRADDATRHHSHERAQVRRVPGPSRTPTLAELYAF